MDDMQIATWAACLGLLIIIATGFGSPLTTPDPRGSCQYGNKAFAIGETFMKNECQPCVCAEENYGPSVNCVYINCAPTHCVNPTYSSSQCCRECPDGLNCQHGDKVLKEGEVYTEGGVTCRCEFVPQQYGPAYRANLPRIPLTTLDPATTCHYATKAIAIGETFLKSACQPCVCVEGRSISCVYITCSPTHCVNPAYLSSQCCQECPDGLNCQHGDKVLKEGEVYMEGCVTCRCEFVPQQYGPAYLAVCNTTHT